MVNNYFYGDRKFVFEHIDWETLAEVHSEVDKEMYEMILEEAGKLSSQTLASRAAENDKAEYLIDEDGGLIWPATISESYQALKETGLLCPIISEEYGGANMPGTIGTFISEMGWQADPGFWTIPGLQTGVAELIQAFASDEIKNEYLPRMVSGELTGAMDLTEDNAGSDLGGIITKATEIDGKTYINGEKIYITNGGAGVHAVLARDEDTFDETRGKTSGISLYLVPWEVEGEKNQVRVTRVEEKLGLHSSPTCVVKFGDEEENGAEGFLIGEKGKGIKYMFRLMNNARLNVAGQALGNIESALQSAKEYAVERKQFGLNITEFGQVKEILADMNMEGELIRAVLYEASFATDMSHGLDRAGRDKEARVYDNKASVLTPLLKFYAAEQSIRLTRLGLQVHGGNGFTTDYPAERHFRDSVITSIYEGTSEIQTSLFLKDALKAVFGKSRANPDLLIKEMYKALDGIESEELSDLVEKVKESGKIVQNTLQHLGGEMMKGMASGKNMLEVFNLISPAAKPLAYMTTEVYGASLLLQQAEKDSSGRKTVLADTYIKNHLLPNVSKYEAEAKAVNLETLTAYNRIVDLEV